MFESTASFWASAYLSIRVSSVLSSLASVGTELICDFGIFFYVAALFIVELFLVTFDIGAVLLTVGS